MAITILGYDHREMGQTPLQYVKSLGLDVVTLNDRDAVDLGEMSFADADVSLYAYTRPSTGAKACIVELRTFYPPDALYITSWVLDGEPSRHDIQHLLDNKGLKAGDTIGAANDAE